ncbi:MAG: exonuclease domain-containing protein [Lachnospiraceae bacterium]|nr:exonuclease domain-containing protein [Lachnospiraceae bacterium]
MNYIVLDLEWNQPLDVSQRVSNLPVEIIEIGAVKLDSDKNRIDEFSRLIKPIVYKELNPNIRQVTHFCEEDLERGDDFETVIADFIVWCGDDFTIGTWGTSDLIELHRNLEYHKNKYLGPGNYKYYDIQKLFSLDTEGKKNPRTLEMAVDYYKIEKKDDFHRALYDARYTAEVFKRLRPEIVETYYSLDLFYNPQKRSDEIFIDYKTYTKFVSKEYRTKKEIFRRKKIREVRCPECEKRTTKIFGWFGTGNGKNYTAVFQCSKHGKIKSKIRINKTYHNENVYATKIVKFIDEEEALHIKEKYLKIKERTEKKKES